MALLRNCEVHYVKCDPKRPNASFSKENPTWEVQIRTTDLEQKREWDAAGLKPKLVVGKEGADDEGMPILTEDGKRQWKVNLKKKSITKDGEKASPVKVVNGSLEDIDPNTVGNGSIANIRVFQYEYKSKGKEGVANVLMAMQLKKHIVYTPKSRDDDFDEEETETINPDEAGSDADFDEDVNDSPAPAAKRAPPVAPRKPVDERPEDAY